MALGKFPGDGQADLGTDQGMAPAVDEVMFCNSGSEATMFAFRAARAVTGKQWLPYLMVHTMAFMTTRW
ncbi:MAG: hypothetical protein CM1200mP12_19650 [Gammaproteobacteria bacterium]|nr:MAG: hypothetical protein CM1200mP12_19650 [Gammaproteobacteria bacterium]